MRYVLMLCLLWPVSMVYGKTSRWGNLDSTLAVNHRAGTIEVKRSGEDRPFFTYSPPGGLGISLEKAVLLGPTRGEAKGPFLSTIWTKGGRDSRIIITFDLSKAKEGVDSMETISHTYISAHEIELSLGNTPDRLDELKIIGKTDEMDEDTGYYGDETLVCQWRYNPQTNRLLCRRQ